MDAILFDRAKHPLELTEAGELYMIYAQRQQVLDREFRQHIADLEGMKRGSLTIGGAGAFNISYLPVAVAEFSAAYPGVQLEIVDGNIPDITAKAMDGQVDIFVTPPWNQDDRVQYEELLSERIYLCVPPDWEINRELEEWRLPEESVLQRRTSHPKAARRTGEEGFSRGEADAIPQVDFTRFKECPFVALKEDQHIGHVMLKLFQKHGFRPQRHITAEQTMTSFGLTMAGAGISLMTESTIRNSNFEEYPAFYMADAEICRRAMYIAHPKNKYLSKAARVFIDILKGTLRNY